MNSIRTTIAALWQSWRSFPALILGLSIAALLSYELVRSYLQAREDAERRVHNLAYLMSEQFTRTVQNVDIDLENIASELENNPAMPKNDPDFRARLQRLSLVPFVNSIFIVGPDGDVIHDTDYPRKLNINLSDREYFTDHRNSPSLGLHISGPMKSRPRGIVFFSLSRRLQTKDGSFAGVVVAAVEPLYFESLYKRLWLGAGTVALLLENGTMLAQSPSPGADKAAGEPAGDIETFRTLLTRKGRNVTWINGPIDGDVRVVAYQRLESAPIVLFVTLSGADVLRPWRSHAIASVVGASILLVLLVLLEYLSIRSRRREKAARLRLEKTQKMEAIGRFASSIAHDCGNLMRVIRSATVVLKPLVADRQEAVKLLGEVDATLDAGRALVNRLLSYARNSEARLDVASPYALIEEVLPIARQAAGPGIEVTVGPDGQTAQCRIDKTQFQAAIINVVLNARDAMPFGGTITIEVRSVEDDNVMGVPGWVDINIQDNGVGMSEEVRRQATDPFFTMEEEGTGNGMGLSQVQEFALQCSGRVDVFSRPDHGTTVRIRLPSEVRAAQAEGTDTAPGDVVLWLM
ncbi:cache domain-containing protein [Rhizobium sp. LjRoot30]|uniref:ATP-binding protein n=1 Tax=Rhizobium sp. LjRoot30 TaxID=3342320 RepID=UPI003ECFF933